MFCCLLKPNFPQLYNGLQNLKEINEEETIGIKELQPKLTLLNLGALDGGDQAF